MKKHHPILNNFIVSNTELDKYVGRICKFINPSCGHEKEIFKVTAVQKDYKGELILRGEAITGPIVESESNKFGKPFDLELVEFIDNLN